MDAVAQCIGGLGCVVLLRGGDDEEIAAIDGGGRHHFVVTLDTGRASIAVAPAAYSADATRVPELWLIPPDGKPRTLGLLRADRAVIIAIPRELLALATTNAVLAVSLEPLLLRQLTYNLKQQPKYHAYHSSVWHLLKQPLSSD